jgi:hypothetical protein
LTYLVDHHDSQEITESSEEETVQVMLDVVADDIAKLIQEDLSDDEDQHTEGDVSERPAVIQCVRNQEQLHSQVYRNADGIQ